MNLIHKEFLIALVNGEEVEHKLPLTGAWIEASIHLSLTTFNNPDVEFRIKSKTVTLSMEIPMPFVPDVGEVYWYFNMDSYTGVYKTNNKADAVDERLIARGVYRTGEDAKQALAAHEAAIAKLLGCAK